MRFEPVRLEHQTLIEKIRRQAGHIRMSHSSSTLFLWQKDMKLEICLEEDFFVVRSLIFGPGHYFFPCGNPAKTYDFIKEVSGDSVCCFHYLSEQDKNYLEENFPAQFEIEYDRGSCEYLYNRSDYVKMEGGNYQRLRYDISKLLRSHTCTVAPLTEEQVAPAEDIIRTWESAHGTDDSLFCDLQTALCLLQNRTALKAEGMVLYLDQEPFAVVVGCEINEDTFCVQLAKMKEHTRGLNYYLFREFYAALPEKYTYINGDDDLDIQGIRSIKEAMKPCRMIDIWQAQRKE